MAPPLAGEAGELLGRGAGGGLEAGELGEVRGRGGLGVAERGEGGLERELGGGVGGVEAGVLVGDRWVRRVCQLRPMQAGLAGSAGKPGDVGT